MKKLLLLSLAIAGLLALALGGTASAKPPTFRSVAATAAPTNPLLRGPVWALSASTTAASVTAISPASASNDIGTSVTITGADFVATPTVSVGSTALTNVTWVNSTTLTATVPWGMNPGTYTLTVVNPDGGSGSLASAFTVTQGLGQWNPGDLFGGQMQQLLMKPGDPNTFYAAAYNVIGLFRSTDACEHWTFVTDKMSANANGFAVDPLHPDWLYAYSNGVIRSQDEGATWTTVMPNKWPDGSDLQAYPHVQVSPYQDATHPQAIFVSSCDKYVIPEGTGPKGLIKSTDGGATWTIVSSLDGVPVQDIAFDPNDHSHMVLVTSDVKVYTSTDWGSTWTQVTTSGLTPTSLGLQGSITYNPGGSEVWINAPIGGIFKSAANDLTSWQDVSHPPGSGSWFLAFSSASSVYIRWFHSINGGTSWDPFGPSPWYGQANFVLDPTNPQTAYITNDVVGVQKTTDLLDPTPTWQDKVQGLTALSCTSMAVSPTDPLRVYATFSGPLGIYRSSDGTSHWSFVPIPGSSQANRILVDPLDAQRVYVAGSGFYTSTDGGDHWTGAGWNLPPSSPSEGLVDIAADPYHAGHLLACFGTAGVQRLMYSTADYGASWQAVDVHPGPGLYNPHCIVFDPNQPGMAGNGDITIATHPQHMVAVDGQAGQFYRSVDGGATWQKAASALAGGTDVFVDRDSTRLYRASAQGLFFSGDAGDSWEPAAGVLGHIQTTALSYADMDGHTILYAATNGGDTGTTSSSAAKTPLASLATTSTLVGAGIYRYVQLPAPKITSLKPTSGPVGAVVTVTGTSFGGATAVRFNGKAAKTFSVVSTTKIKATVPAGAKTGKVTVVTQGGTATSAAKFTVLVKAKVTLRLIGLKGKAIKLGKYLTAKGTVKPASLKGSKVMLTVQRKKGSKWLKLKSAARKIGAKGAYSWKYKPAKKGICRIRATIAKTSKHTAATTKWLTFKVK